MLQTEELLSSVADHLAAEGLRRFTLRRAATAAGTTHKVLLYHFGSADELIHRAVDVVRSRATSRGRAFVAALPEGDLRTRLTLAWTVWQQPSGTPPVLGEALGLAMAEPERFGEIGARATRDVLQTLGLGLAPSVPDDVDVEVVSTLLLAVLRGLHIDRTVTGQTARVDAAYTVFVKALTRVVDGPVGALLDRRDAPGARC